MTHIEGGRNPTRFTNPVGWPKEVDDLTDTNLTAKYKKKLDRNPEFGFAMATKDLVGQSEKCIRQNNEIDLFEEYHTGEQPEHTSEIISTKTVMIFKDPNPIKRAITKIVWHPDYQTEMRVGVAYAILRFQQMPGKMPLNVSFID